MVTTLWFLPSFKAKLLLEIEDISLSPKSSFESES